MSDALAPLGAEELAFIARAAGYLEKPSLLIRLADLAGKPVEWILRKLPGFAQRIVHRAVERALRSALSAALRTLGDVPRASGSIIAAESSGAPRRLGHVLSASATGAVGGFFGVVALPVELPLTTVLMLRSIADVAGTMGEDLTTTEGRLECLTVFSLGGPSKDDDASETSYYGQRVALARLVDEAAKWAARASAHEMSGALKSGEAPALVRLIARIAARFDIAVTEKEAAQAIPVLGALGGAVVNAVFTSHYNELARYHFGLRRLEREHGAAEVKAAYGEAARRLK